MTKVLLSGCAGRMGRVITDLAAEDDGIEIVGGVDLIVPEHSAYPVWKSIGECTQEADVIIDFSSPKVFDEILDYAVKTGTALVICTTGLDERQAGRIGDAAKEIPVLRSANMSLGINLLIKLLKQAAPVLSGAGFDIEIVEQHHNRKKDAPSGTALALADSINDACDGKYHYRYDRSQVYEQRAKDEIGISAVRGGTIVGIHDVLFAGTDEVIELKHTAYSRAIFAKGAIAAAKYLTGKPAGFYQMSDVIDG